MKDNKICVICITNSVLSVNAEITIRMFTEVAIEQRSMDKDVRSTATAVTSQYSYAHNAHNAHNARPITQLRNKYIIQ